MPYLVTEEGSLGESNAIARFMCNSSPDTGLYGSSVQEKANIDEIVERHTSFMAMHAFKALGPVLGFSQATTEEFSEAAKKIKDYIRTLDEAIKNKEFFFGDKLSLADVYIAVTMNLFFATFIDAGFRKAVPNFSAWYEKTRNNDVIVSVIGKPRYCGKAMKPHSK